MRHVSEFVFSLFFFAFIAIKVAGVQFALWSWWWLLMTPVPVLALLLGKMGLL